MEQFVRFLRIAWVWLIIVPGALISLVGFAMVTAHYIGWPLSIVTWVLFCGLLAAWMVKKGV